MELKSLKISLKSTKVHIKQHFQIYIKTRAKVAQNFGFIIISVLIIIIFMCQYLHIFGSVWLLLVILNVSVQTPFYNIL